MHSNRPSKFDLIFVIVVCGLVSAVLLGLATFILWRWAPLVTWEPVPATVQALRITSSPDKNRVTYTIRASYTYLWEDTYYTRDRVNLYDGMSPAVSGRYLMEHGKQLSLKPGIQEKDLPPEVLTVYRLAQELHKGLRSQEPITVWVNPHDPAQSIISKELRGKSLLLLALGGAVFVWATLALFDSFLHWPHPDNQRKSRWRPTVPLTKIGLIVLGFIPLLYVGIVLIGYGMEWFWSVRNLALTLVAFLVAGWSIRTWLRRRRYHLAEARLEWKIKGNKGVGEIQIPVLPENSHFRIRLQCHEVIKMGHAGWHPGGYTRSSTTTQVVRFSETIDAKPIATPHGVRIPFHWDLPDYILNAPYLRWTIEVCGYPREQDEFHTNPPKPSDYLRRWDSVKIQRETWPQGRVELKGWLVRFALPNPNADKE